MRTPRITSSKWTSADKKVRDFEDKRCNRFSEKLGWVQSYFWHFSVVLNRLRFEVLWIIHCNFDCIICGLGKWKWKWPTKRTVSAHFRPLFAQNMPELIKFRSDYITVKRFQVKANLVISWAKSNVHFVAWILQWCYYAPVRMLTNHEKTLESTVKG